MQILGELTVSQIVHIVSKIYAHFQVIFRFICIVLVNGAVMHVIIPAENIPIAHTYTFVLITNFGQFKQVHSHYECDLHLVVGLALVTF